MKQPTCRGYVYRIDRLTPEQTTAIRENIGCRRYLWNKYVDEFTTALANGERYKQSSYTVYSHDPDTPWLRQADACNLNTTKLDFAKAVIAFYKQPEHGKPKYKKKHTSVKSYQTTNNTTVDRNGVIHNTITMDGAWLKLPKIGRVHLIKHRGLPRGHRIVSATVTEVLRGVFEVSLLVKYDYDYRDSVYINRSEVIGLDYSSTDFYVDSNGGKPVNPHSFRSLESRIASASAVRDARVYHSKNWWRADDVVKRLYKKTADCRSDFTHKASASIAKEYKLVCVEDLDLRGLSQSLRLGKSTMDNGFGGFRERLAYKLAGAGGVLVKTPRFFPSTRLCSCCGERLPKGSLSLSDREWVCPSCGARHDRDVNAAVNIRDMGVFGLLCSGVISAVVSSEGEWFDLSECFGVGGLCPDYEGLYSVACGALPAAETAVVTYVVDVLRVFEDDAGFRVMPWVVSDSLTGAFITAKKNSWVATREASDSTGVACQ